MHSLDNTKIAIIGLGYVGLPLAVEFGKRFDTVGFDIHAARIEQLRAGIDRTQETSANELAASSRLAYTDDLQALRDCNVFIVSVPTPVDEDKRPDFTPLIKASESIGKVLKRGDVVIYESTAYPGATEEICVPELERVSGLQFNIYFTAGYSPKRINPGDNLRRLSTIPKITYGFTLELADYVNALYRTIITACAHKAPSLNVAEASVIENTQCNANIALIKFALIFNQLGIDPPMTFMMTGVLEAAATKSNFLPSQLGLFGGYYISVVPYYLIQRDQSVGHYPDILLACCRINDGMREQVASAVVKLMMGKRHAINGSRARALGLIFKENCQDLRNARVVGLVKDFKSYGAFVNIYDPCADAAEAKVAYGNDLALGASAASPFRRHRVRGGAQRVRGSRQWRRARYGQWPREALILHGSPTQDGCGRRL